MHIDFGRTIEDYQLHRQGFPTRFYQALTHLIARHQLNPGSHDPWAGLKVLDVGTGPGVIALSLARLGAEVTALDPSPVMVAACQARAEAEGLSVTVRHAPAEAPDLPAHTFDLVIAGQCWHWFDRPVAAKALTRLLKPGGLMCIAHLDWLARVTPDQFDVVQATTRLVRAHNPQWPPAGLSDGRHGLYPGWPGDLRRAGLLEVETCTFDVPLRYTAEAWRGRVRASAGVGASLSEAAIARFDAELADRLAPAGADFDVPHRIFLATGVAPSAQEQAA